MGCKDEMRKCDSIKGKLTVCVVEMRLSKKNVLRRCDYIKGKLTHGEFKVKFI